MTPESLENGRYELGSRLGHGGMATVFLAEDTKLGRPVAIKLLADNLAHDDDFRERFMREARLAAQLDHPNVVQVFDVSGDEDRPFIVMEHVDGGTLGDVVDRRRRLDSSDALELLRQGCRGLGHAHDRKLVHRDVKPHNLLIRRSDGCLKVADFGIARAAEDTRLTRTGNVIGTERYMAPEQLQGGRVSPATDVYSLGVVATEVLGAEADPAIAPVIDRCLSEDPRDRYGDANELCAALGEADGAAGALTVPIPSRSEDPDPTGPTAAVPIPPGAGDPTAVRPGRSGRSRWGLPAVLAGMALVAAGVIFALSAGGGDEGGGEEPKAGIETATIPVVEGPAQGAPQLEDPAQQAPALSRWIRDNSE